MNLLYLILFVWGFSGIIAWSYAMTRGDVKEMILDTNPDRRTILIVLTFISFMLMGPLVYFVPCE